MGLEIPFYGISYFRSSFHLRFEIQHRSEPKDNDLFIVSVAPENNSDRAQTTATNKAQHQIIN